jgi:hypothetical protein
MRNTTNHNRVGLPEYALSSPLASQLQESIGQIPCDRDGVSLAEPCRGTITVADRMVETLSS